MKLSVTEDINGQKYVRMSDEKRNVTMTNQEAITIIKELMIACTSDSKYYKVGDMAINALEQEPLEVEATELQKAYNKGFEDCRQAVMDCFKKWQPYMATRLWDFEQELSKLPPVNPQEPKTGHWEWVQYDYNPKIGNWHCSECRCIVVECVGKEEEGGIPLYKYCPQCGVKIVEPKESEDKE